MTELAQEGKLSDCDLGRIHHRWPVPCHKAREHPRNPGELLGEHSSIHPPHNQQGGSISAQLKSQNKRLLRQPCLLDKILPLAHILQRSKEEQGAECNLGRRLPWHERIFEGRLCYKWCFTFLKASTFFKINTFCKKAILCNLQCLKSVQNLPTKSFYG